jgi:hypothetical protein
MDTTDKKDAERIFVLLRRAHESEWGRECQVEAVAREGRGRQFVTGSRSFWQWTRSIIGKAHRLI